LLALQGKEKKKRRLAEIERGPRKKKKKRGKKRLIHAIRPLLLLRGKRKTMRFALVRETQKGKEKKRPRLSCSLFQEEKGETTQEKHRKEKERREKREKKRARPETSLRARKKRKKGTREFREVLQKRLAIRREKKKGTTPTTFIIPSSTSARIGERKKGELEAHGAAGRREKKREKGRLKEHILLTGEKKKRTAILPQKR